MCCVTCRLIQGCIAQINEFAVCGPACEAWGATFVGVPVSLPVFAAPCHRHAGDCAMLPTPCQALLHALADIHSQLLPGSVYI
jgi:hypothetical protein